MRFEKSPNSGSGTSLRSWESYVCAEKLHAVWEELLATDTTDIPSTSESEEAPGTLAREAGVDKNGLSLERWLF